MHEYRQVEAATRIGMLTRESDRAAACAEALRTLGQLLANDAATLAAVDPFSGKHFQLAGIECTGEAARSLAVEFVGTPWYRTVVSETLPPSISDEPGQPFRRGWFYEQYIQPAGFRDGMSGALRHRGRYVGMIHVSAERSAAFDTEARRLLASVMPALAALADSTERVGEFRDLPDGASAALFTRCQVVDLPDRERPPMLADAEFRHLLAGFDASGGQRLRLLWPVGQDWYRVVLSRQPLPGGATPQAVLVHAHPLVLPYRLSPRELDVLTRVAMGHANRTIAEGLFLSPRTVHSHLEHILRKTGTGSRAEATALALRDGLLRPLPDGLKYFLERQPDREIDGRD